MGTTWKPVQPTEIKDIKIIREVIAQIRKPISPEVYARIEEENRELAKMIKTTKPGWEKCTVLPKMNKPKSIRWDDVRKELFTPEEIAESDLRVAIIGELIKARREKGFSQKKLEELSGVRQPVIARMEKGNNPQLDTVLKVLAPLGKTLSVVSLPQE
jgi:DNA-binding phage protein